MATRDVSMTAQHALLIVAATLAAASKMGRPIEEVYTEYARVLARVRHDDINPNGHFAPGERL